MAWKTVRTGSSSKSLKSRVAIASSRASAVRTPTCLVTIACLLREGASPDACSPHLQPERVLRAAWELYGCSGGWTGAGGRVTRRSAGRTGIWWRRRTRPRRSGVLPAPHSKSHISCPVDDSLEVIRSVCDTVPASAAKNALGGGRGLGLGLTTHPERRDQPGQARQQRYEQGDLQRPWPHLAVDPEDLRLHGRGLTGEQLGQMRVRHHLGVL